jgi:hypothetical protein
VAVPPEAEEAVRPALVVAGAVAARPVAAGEAVGAVAVRHLAVRAVRRPVALAEAAEEAAVDCRSSHSRR